MSHYIFDNAAQQANQRFSSLETLYDPWTISHLEATGIRETGKERAMMKETGSRNKDG